MFIASVVIQSTIDIVNDQLTDIIVRSIVMFDNKVDTITVNLTVPIANSTISFDRDLLIVNQCSVNRAITPIKTL